MAVDGTTAVLKVLRSDPDINQCDRCKIERCKVDPATLRELDAQVGGQSDFSHPDGRLQILVRRRANPDLYALFTVIGTRRTAGRTLYLGTQGLKRLKGGHSGDEVEIDVTVLTPDFTEGYRGAKGNSLAILTPHGGDIEPGTYQQGEYVRRHSADGLQPSSWFCRGNLPSKDDFDRLHITSTDLSLRSFPGLRRIFTAAPFAFAGSFHGFHETDQEPPRVIVGGECTNDLKRKIRAKIRLRNPAIDVVLILDAHTDHPRTDPSGPQFQDYLQFAGAGDDNVVNRLASRRHNRAHNSVQFEQNQQARRPGRWEVAARAFVDAFGESSTTTPKDRSVPPAQVVKIERG
jgi:Poly-gamma-glutamate hydrolase